MGVWVAGVCLPDEECEVERVVWRGGAAMGLLVEAWGVLDIDLGYSDRVGVLGRGWFELKPLVPSRRDVLYKGRRLETRARLQKWCSKGSLYLNQRVLRCSAMSWRISLRW